MDDTGFAGPGRILMEEPPPRPTAEEVAAAICAAEKALAAAVDQAGQAQARLHATPIEDLFYFQRQVELSQAWNHVGNCREKLEALRQ